MAAHGIQPGRWKDISRAAAGIRGGPDRFPLHVESRGARSFPFWRGDGVSAHSVFARVRAVLCARPCDGDRAMDARIRRAEGPLRFECGAYGHCGGRHCALFPVANRTPENRFRPLAGERGGISKHPRSSRAHVQRLRIRRLFDLDTRPGAQSVHRWKGRCVRARRCVCRLPSHLPAPPRGAGGIAELRDSVLSDRAGRCARNVALGIASLEAGLYRQSGRTLRARWWILAVTSEIPPIPLLESGTNQRPTRYVLTALALFSIAVVYVLTIVQLRPSNLFGLTGDDGIYMSSAKALAEGKGYVMPNLPGSPTATKYPVLYPLVLSFVWRVNPLFPANLPLAIAISVAFGVGFLMAAFAMFSSLGGFSRREALILTAYLGLHPLVMFFGASILSEMPFAFLALASMTVAERFMRPNEGRLGSVCSGALAGLSVLTRILGFPILLGILVTGIMRRSWRQLATFVLTAAPFVGIAAWNAIFSKKPASPITGPAGASLGWRHAWTFYTDYAGIWKVGVPNLHIFWAMLQNNAGMILRQPADLLLGPTFVRDTMLGRALVLTVAVAALAGIVRQGKQSGWKPIHFGLAFYAPIVLLWNYPAVNRFFLPFWPLLVAGAWFEGRRVVQQVKSAMSHSRHVRDKCIAAAVGLVVVALACGVVENVLGGMRRVVKRTSDERRVLLRDKEECYAWIRDNTKPDSRLVAYEDAPTYLYTGREAVRPMIFTTDEFYES